MTSKPRWSPSRAALHTTFCCDCSLTRHTKSNSRTNQSVVSARRLCSLIGSTKFCSILCGSVNGKLSCRRVGSTAMRKKKMRSAWLFMRVNFNRFCRKTLRQQNDGISEQFNIYLQCFWLCFVIHNIVNDTLQMNSLTRRRNSFHCAQRANK